MASVPSAANGQRRYARASRNVSVDIAGWLTCSASYRVPVGWEQLESHANWSGPHKVVGRGSRHVRISEVFIDPQAEWDVAGFQEMPAAREQLVERLLETTLAPRPEPCLATWEPPAAADVSEHLRAAGHDSAMDDQGNLRFTLKVRGVDGQVQMERGLGRLRLVMPLGRWDRLNDTQERSLLDLARRHNDRVRLVRIAWEADGSTRRCTAQVDLSGLPCEPDHAWVWSSNLRMAVGGLSLTLHQIGKELDVLADPRNERLAAWILSHYPQNAKSFARPGQPR